MVFISDYLVRYEHHNETRVTIKHEALAEGVSNINFINKVHIERVSFKI